MATGFFFPLLLLILLFSDHTDGTLDFSNKPTAKSVLEGNDVTLPCEIEDYDPALHTVLWYRAELVIANDTAVTEGNSRISIISDPKLGWFNLQIADVRPSDDHSYECMVCNSSGVLIRSLPARLDVQTTPAPQFPNCSPLEKADFTEGENVITKCSSERANPPVVLQWYQGSLKVTSTQEDESGVRSATHTIVITENHNGAVFQCKMTTNAIANYEKSCTVGPLSVRYRPRVTVVPSQEVYEVGDRIHLDCDSNANPQPYKHTWHTPEYPLYTYKFTEGSRYLETMASAELNGTEFSCNATNRIGSGMSSPLRLIVMPRRDITDGVGAASNPGSNQENNGIGVASLPGKGTSSAPEELDNMLLLLVIAILSIMIITLAIVLLFKCHHNHRRSVNADVVYNGPSTIFNSSNIDRAWDGNSIYYEPQDQISVTYDPMWQTTLPLPPELQRNVGVQVPYHEDPHYAEIELDWDEKHGTLEL